MRTGKAMCEDLENKIEEISENSSSDLSKDAKKLFRATMRSIRNLSEQFKAHIVADNKWRNEIDSKVDELLAKFDSMKSDAEKGRAAAIVLNALFGNARRAIMTLLFVAVILGLTNIKDIMELLKMFLV